MSHPHYPRSITLTTWLVLTMIMLSAVTALLTWVRHDDLVLAWAERNTAAARILAQDGLEALKQSTLVPSFVPLAIVSVLVFAPLAGVLLIFMRERIGWSRAALTATVTFSAVLAVQGISRDLPNTFMVLSTLSLVVQIAVLVSIWLPENGRFMRSAENWVDLTDG